VRETSIDPRLIEMEVTETVIIESRGTAREAIDKVAALGAGIVIDDFGTGYAGLAYLKRLPVTKLKIDQTFVRNLPSDRGDAAIVAAILAMARGPRRRGGGRRGGNGRAARGAAAAGMRMRAGFLLSRPLTVDRADALVGARVAASPTSTRSGRRP